MLAASAPGPGVVSHAKPADSEARPISASSPNAGIEFKVSLTRFENAAPEFAEKVVVTPIPFASVVVAVLPPTVHDVDPGPIGRACPSTVNISA